MTIPNILFGQYAPTNIEIDNLAIDVSQNTLQNLDLGTTSLIVGETSNTIGVNSYGLIVDKEGLGINTSISIRDANRGYNLYVDGDVFVSGKIISNDAIQVGVSNVNSNYWLLAPDNTFENIYYTDTVSIVNSSSHAMSNLHALNIVKNAFCNVDAFQVSIENTEAAQIRMGFFGRSNLSPSIINTPPGTNIEFHSGRDQSYFNRTYTSSNYLTIVDNIITGANHTELVVKLDDIPHYDTSSNSDAPHMRIDQSGNVGIHTSANIPLNYNIRTFPNGVVYSNVNNPMTLHVSGPLFGEDIIMRDRDTGLTQHLDELYIRRLGPTFSPCQILPGTFANGDYKFRCNIYVDNEILTSNLKVYNSTDTNYFVASNSIINHSMFLDNINGSNDIYLGGSVRFSGGLLHKEYVTDPITGSNIESWVSISFNTSNTSLSNINYIGTGITTPGRFGTGINPTSPLSAFPYDNVVNTQLSINKADSNIWELMILDKTTSGIGAYRKAAYVGHPPKNNSSIFAVNTISQNDASLVFATPMENDINFSASLGHINQNFYFFPGANFKTDAGPILDPTKPPTLGIFTDPSNRFTRTDYTPGRVGINTYNPFGNKTIKGLDVNGSFQYSDKFFYNADELGINYWHLQRDISDKILGIYYNNTDAPYVGINISPDSRYGLLNNGKFKSINGYFDQNDYKLGYLYDNTDTYTVTNAIPTTPRKSLFTFSKIGINAKYPTADIDIFNYTDNETSIKIHTSLLGSLSSLIFSGISTDGTIKNNDWSIRTNDKNQSTFQIGYGSNINNFDSNERAIWSKFNNNINRHQVFVGSNLLCPDYINYGINSSGNPDLTPKYPILTVGGDLSVMGNVAVTGQYYMKGSLQINSNINGITSLSNIEPTNNDVYIGGTKIIFTPDVASGNKVKVTDSKAYSIDTLNPAANESIFEVQQAINSRNSSSKDIIASFITPNQS